MSTLLSLAALLLHLTIDPSGHWEGVISAQFGTIHIELDLTANANGEASGTFSVPERKLKGIPLVSLRIDGKAISFEPAAVGARFQGDFSDDGKSITGMFEGAAGTVPLALTRTGDARVPATPTSGAIGSDLEGVWSGTIEAKRLVLKLANQANQTASATMISVDEGGLELPIAIVQNGVQVKLDVPGVGSSYAGALSADGKELIGTYTTADGIELALTFRKK
jgi:hypothetical protein